MVPSLFPPTRLLVAPIALREASVVECVLGSPNGHGKCRNRPQEDEDGSYPKKDQ
jgi:hypothetical protein